MKILPINTTDEGLAYAIKASYFKNASLTTLTQGGRHFPCTGAVEIHSDEHDVRGVRLRHQDGV